MFPFQFNSSFGRITYNRNNKKHKDNQEIETPDYFNLISEEDKSKYRELQKMLISPENRYARNRRVETLKESLEEIRKFCLRNDEDDWKRCLVCGIIWMNNDHSISKEPKDDKNNDNSIESISINIRQLKVILGKSKSTINGAMAKMGFTTCPTKGEDQNLLLKAMPYFEGKYFEMRQWTIRKRKLSKEEKQKENKETDAIDEFSFLSLTEYENEEIKFENLDFTDNDFWFTTLGIDTKNIYDFSVSTLNNSDNNMQYPKSSQTFNSKNNSNIFESVELILQINNFMAACNIFFENLDGIFKGSKLLISLNGMFFSYIYQLYMIYSATLMAFLAGQTVPRIQY